MLNFGRLGWEAVVGLRRAGKFSKYRGSALKGLKLEEGRSQDTRSHVTTRLDLMLFRLQPRVLRNAFGFRR